MGAPTVCQVKPHEMVQVLGEAVRIGKAMNPDHLVDVLATIKSIVMPLVPWLGKDLDPLFWPPEKSSIPEETMKRSALIIYEGFGKGRISIALSRDGNWLVLHRQPDQDGVMCRMHPDSKEIANVVLDDIMFVLERTGNLNLVVNRVRLQFFEGLIVHDEIIKFVKEVFQTIAKLIDEREERLRNMRERLGLVKNMADMLDPIVSQGLELSIGTYAVWLKTARGTSRKTTDYLHPKAIEPFGKVLEEADPKGSRGYKIEPDQRIIRSINDLIGFATHHARNIISTPQSSPFLGPDSKKEDRIMLLARRVLDDNSSRIDFIKEEVDTLRTLVGQISGGTKPTQKKGVKS